MAKIKKRSIISVISGKNFLSVRQIGTFKKVSIKKSKKYGDYILKTGRKIEGRYGTLKQAKNKLKKIMSPLKKQINKL